MFDKNRPEIIESKRIILPKNQSQKNLNYDSNDFQELEKNLMLIVNEEICEEFLGSHSTVSSPDIFSICNHKNVENFDIQSKKKDKFTLSSILKDNWAERALQFKFSVFDKILTENKILEEKKSPQKSKKKFFKF